MKRVSKDELLLRIRQHKRLDTAEQLLLTVMLSVPAILAQMSTILLFYIDDAMVGSLGAQASASVGIVATTIWLFWSVISCVAMGFSVQVAHAVGANRIRKARSIFRQSLMTAVVVSLVTMLVGIAIAGRLPLWLGGGEEIVHDASLYFLIFIFGTPMSMTNMLASSMLRCAGNIKVPSWANVGMCVFNVIVNFFLIFPTRDIMVAGCEVTMPGMGWGVAGSAAGTVIAETVVAMYLLWYASVRCHELRQIGVSHVTQVRQRGVRHSFIPERGVLHNAARIGGPVLMQRVLMNAAQIVTTIIVAPLGTIAIAANVLGITAESLCYMPGYGIGEAATTLVGQSYGAGRMKLTERFAWMTTLLGMGVMGVMGIVMYVCAPLMMASLTPVEAVRTLGTECLRIEAWAEPGFAASIVAMSCFVGTGDTRTPALMNLFSIWFVRVTLAMVLATKWGLQGVWIAMAIELTFRGAIFLVRLMIKTREYRNIYRKKTDNDNNQ